MSALPFDTASAEWRFPIARELTPRERTVVELLAQGYSRKATAAALGISTHTLAHHIEHIAALIPSDLAATSRVIAWARGAGAAILMGTPAIAEVTDTR